MAAAKKAAAPAPPPSNSQYPFYIHPKIIINFDFVEYDKSGRKGGEPVEIVEYNLLHLISYSFSPFLSLFSPTQFDYYFSRNVRSNSKYEMV